MKKLVGALAVVLACAAVFMARIPSSHACSGDLAVPDKQLLKAIDASLAGHASTTNATDDAASTQQKYVEKALQRTFEKDIVAAAVERSCAVFVNGASRFSLHVLTYQDAATADSMRRVVEKRKANTLKIEALTYYAFFPAGATIVFFVADRQDYAENMALFEDIKRRYGAG